MRLPIGVTTSEYLRRRKKAPHNPPYQGNPRPMTQDIPVASMPSSTVVDPILDQGMAREVFDDWQLAEGGRLKASGVGPQTAGEAIQMQLVSEYERLQPELKPLPPERRRQVTPVRRGSEPFNKASSKRPTSMSSRKLPIS